ncbi:MAG: Rieske 2Fe-2S domain-containing protein [Porticoccaceae bacterium]|nr:Rieske 2Fe-2S domain-containing protein [Porticoccaceae bacterium]
MNIQRKDLGQRRSEAPSVQDYLDREKRQVPTYLRDNAYTYQGSEDLPAERWYSREFYDSEIKHVWPRTWQLVCVEEELAQPGDYVVYDIVHWSFIVVRRSDGTLGAYYNSCMHRATRLCDAAAGHATEFRCPFHGWVHSIDGYVSEITCEWDFDHLDEQARQMPRAQVDTWQGLVFINMDPAAPSLREYIGNLDDAFARYPLTSKRKSAHVQKPLPCNWKIALEQFIEAYHVIATHPEGLPYIGDANAQYNIWPDNDHVSRMHTLHSVASPHVGDRYSEQEKLDIITDISDKAGTQKRRIVLPEGMSTREFLAEERRRLLKEEYGLDCSELTDAEMLDTIHYFIFPNIVVWTAYGSPIIYRFRPHMDDPRRSVMDVMFMTPFDTSKPRPPSAEIDYLSAESSWTEAKSLGRMGWVFDQDTSNAPLVQAGVMASGKRAVSLGNYQEARIRHFHHTLDKYINNEPLNLGGPNPRS